jgi:hypothetical protein
MDIARAGKWRRRYHVTAPVVALGHDVEEERLDIVVESLVVEEQFGHQAHVLAVDLVLLAVHLGMNEHTARVSQERSWTAASPGRKGTHLKDGQRAVSVDLVARRVAQVALELHEVRK